MVSLQRSSKALFSTGSFNADDNTDKDGADGLEIEDDNFHPQKPELQLQGVDPRRGWNFRGVHRVHCDFIEWLPHQKASADRQ